MKNQQLYLFVEIILSMWLGIGVNDVQDSKYCAKGLSCRTSAASEAIHWTRFGEFNSVYALLQYDLNLYSYRKCGIFTIFHSLYLVLQQYSGIGKEEWLMWHLIDW